VRVGRASANKPTTQIAANLDVDRRWAAIKARISKLA